ALIGLGLPELAAPAMREWLRDPDIEWRRLTMQELNYPAAETPTLVPLLIGSLKDADAQTPYQPWPRSAPALGVMGLYSTPGQFGFYGQLGALGVAGGFAGLNGLGGFGG